MKKKKEVWDFCVNAGAGTSDAGVEVDPIKLPIDTTVGNGVADNGLNSPLPPKKMRRLQKRAMIAKANTKGQTDQNG